jgi:hypothetical protein
MVIVSSMLETISQKIAMRVDQTGHREDMV